MEAENSRFSVVPDRGNGPNPENVDAWTVNPWRVITDAASEGQSGLQRAFQWLQVLARSGVSIPISTYMQLAAFIRDFEAPFETHESLIECITATCWLKSFGAQDLLGLIATVHDRLGGWIQSSLATATNIVAM